MTIQENIPLKDHTTFKIGGPARYFVAVQSLDELKEATAYARTHSLPLLVLGGGSNVLISDHGFNGVVIKIEIKGIEIKDKDNETAEVIAGAGENWDSFVETTVKKGLYGLENLSLIPGSVGAAPVQNIGAYGAEVKDTIAWVEAFNCEIGEITHFSNEACTFAYRDSFFKKPENKKYIITRVAFDLLKQGMLNTTYKDIAEFVKNIPTDEITLQKVREIVIDIRSNKLPDINTVGTAGSFFKNPIVTQEKFDELRLKYPSLPGFAAAANFVKIPAAWMLDNLCGFKGFREADAGVYKNQALVLVNFGSASSQDIYSLAQKMTACVKEKTNIELEKEVQIIF